MDKKRCLIFLGIFLFILLLQNLSSLAVSPAKKEINFEPGYEVSYNYRVFGIPENRVVDISLEGELAEYAKASETQLVGGGNFRVDLKLPREIETPGKNVIWVKVSERIDPELKSMVGTSVNIMVAIVVYVPYPGKYIEINNFASRNVNINEPVMFDFKLTSRGYESVNFIPRIDVATENNVLLKSLYMEGRSLETGQSIELQKSFNTTGYNPGRYRAVLVIDYGGVAKADTNFRIGDLLIEIINYTSVFDVGGLRKFEILIESGWNDMISGAYADVSIFNKSGIVDNFKTSTETLKPWEEKVILGYLDTSELVSGKYNANITINYFGKDTGKSTSKLVEIELIENKNKKMILILGIIGCSLLLLGLVIFLIFKKLRRKKKK